MQDFRVQLIRVGLFSGGDLKNSLLHGNILKKNVAVTAFVVPAFCL